MEFGTLIPGNCLVRWTVTKWTWSLVSIKTYSMHLILCFMSCMVEYLIDFFGIEIRNNCNLMNDTLRWNYYWAIDCVDFFHFFLSAIVQLFKSNLSISCGEIIADRWKSAIWAIDWTLIGGFSTEGHVHTSLSLVRFFEMPLILFHPPEIGISSALSIWFIVNFHWRPQRDTRRGDNDLQLRTIGVCLGELSAWRVKHDSTREYKPEKRSSRIVWISG